MPITAQELRSAGELVHLTMGPTPQFRWPLLSEAVGADVVVKHENHLPVGAFKVRGGLVFVDRLRATRPHVTRLVSATRGNHGQSLAYAGVGAGLQVTIVVPHGNSVDKNASMRALGAEVVEHGHDFQAAREYAATLVADDRNAEFVPSFHPDLVLGVATYADELFSAHPDLETVYVPVGLGSGICALIAVRDLFGLETEIVGVVSERADATARSFTARRAVSTDTADTFADGVACRVPDEEAIAVIVAGAARIVTVSEDGIAEAMRLLLRTTHNVAEPAGAVSLAGLCAERDVMRGRRVGVILSGGNADSELISTVLAGRTPGSSGRTVANT